VKGSSFKHMDLKLLEGQTKPAAQDPSPFLCVFAEEVCTETRALLPCVSCAYPFWVQLFCKDEGNVPQGLFAPPLITHFYPSHMVHIRANYCLQQSSAFMEQAESNHCSIFGNHVEQTTSFGDSA